MEVERAEYWLVLCPGLRLKGLVETLFYEVDI